MIFNPIFGVWQFLLVWAFGFFLERRFRFDIPHGYRAALAFGIGETVLSYFYFALGLVGGLRFWVLIPLAIVGSVLLLPQFIRELRTLVHKAWPYILNSPFTSITITLLFFIYLAGTCVPEREVDAVWYHLGVPLHYITHGGFIQLVPFNMPSHYPMNAHLHYIFSLLVGNEMTAKAFTLFHFIPIAILLWSVCAKYFDARWGLFCVVLYFSCLHFRLPVMANVQRPVYFYIFLSTVLLWNALETRHWKMLITASLFCGVAMGTKFNGLIFAYIAQWLLLPIWSFLLRKETFFEGFKRWCAHSLLAWLMMSPWLIKSWLYTGNPFYPLLGQFFSTRDPFVAPMLSNAENHGLNFMQSKTLAAFVGEIIHNVNYYLYNADILFFLGMVSVPTLLLIRKKEWTLPAISGAIMLFLFTWLWGFDIGRLFAASYTILVLLITFTLGWIVTHFPHWKIIKHIVLIGVVCTFVLQKHAYLSSDNIRWFGQVTLSEQSRQEWLIQRKLFSRGLFQMRDYMKEHIPPSDELYAYRMGYLFYLDRKFITCDSRFTEQLDPWLRKGPSHAYKMLASYNVQWLLTKDSAIPIHSELAEAWKAFEEAHLVLHHTENEIRLYRLVPEKTHM
jgi:hypothetical protein